MKAAKAAKVLLVIQKHGIRFVCMYHLNLSY